VQLSIQKVIGADAIRTPSGAAESSCLSCCQESSLTLGIKTLTLVQYSTVLTGQFGIWYHHAIVQGEYLFLRKRN
jgi:hypothetical protein